MTWELSSQSKQESPPVGNCTRRTARSVTCPGGIPVLFRGYPCPGWLGVPVLEYPKPRLGCPRKDLGPESGERTEQTENITFNHPSDAVGNKCGMKLQSNTWCTSGPVLRVGAHRPHEPSSPLSELVTSAVDAHT